MRGQTFTDTTTFIVEDCCNCGIPFGIPTDTRQRLIREKTPFYCPAGHPQHYTGQSHAQQLRNALLDRDEALFDRNKAAQERDRIANDLLDHVTKTKKLKARIRSGTCMKCRRHFANVAAHMKGQHPRAR
jgi:hypothetical protein